MKINYELILRIISILSMGTCFVTFIVTQLITNTKSPNYIEYTDLSKFFLNLYIFLILLLCLVHSVYPSFNFPFVTEGLGIITTIKGKIILPLAIDIMYYSTENLPKKLFGMISFVAIFALFLGNIVFNCEILKQKPLEENDIINANTNINNASNNNVESNGTNNSSTITDNNV